LLQPHLRRDTCGSMLPGLESGFRIGSNHAAHQLPRVWPRDLDRSRSMSAVWAPEPTLYASTRRPDVLRLFSDSNYEMSEVRSTKLCRASSEHLRPPRRGWGIRTAMRKLLRLRRVLENVQMGHRRSHLIYHSDDLRSEPSLMGECRWRKTDVWILRSHAVPLVLHGLTIKARVGGQPSPCSLSRSSPSRASPRAWLPRRCRPGFWFASGRWRQYARSGP